MLGELALRTITELGPWLWMLIGFALIAVEIFSGRAVALSLAFGAIITGTIAVLGTSGVLPETPGIVQILLFIVASSAIFAGLKLRPKTA